MSKKKSEILSLHLSRIPGFPWLLWALFILAVFSFPQRMRHWYRKQWMDLFSPLYHFFHSLQPAETFSSLERENLNQREQENLLEWQYQQLERENFLLKERLEQSFTADSLPLIFWEKISQNRHFPREKSPFLERRIEEERRLLSLYESSIVAHVISRSPDFWSSFVYLNAGESVNRSLGRKVVQKNSPVVSGNCVVGVVECVEEEQSLVRLLTDSSLQISVRTARGYMHLLQSQQNAMHILHTLSLSSPSFLTEQERESVIQALELYLSAGFFSEEDQPRDHGSLLAKGVVHGESVPLWRSQAPFLRGVGFNYDFSDQEGKARDLRSGKYLDRSYTEQSAQKPLIQWGDLLLTTGMDGVFPAGLHVGVVSKILPLQEGAISYEIEANLAAVNIHALTTCLILPPLHLQEIDQ